MPRDAGSLIFRQELLFGAVISVTAGPTEHLSVSLAPEAAVSYVSALSDARNPKNDEEQRLLTCAADEDFMSPPPG